MRLHRGLKQGKRTPFKRTHLVFDPISSDDSNAASVAESDTQVFHFTNNFAVHVMLALLSIHALNGSRTDDIRFVLWGTACAFLSAFLSAFDHRVHAMACMHGMYAWQDVHLCMCMHKDVGM